MIPLIFTSPDPAFAGLGLSSGESFSIFDFPPELVVINM
jgi:hypothetical protein